LIGTVLIDLYQAGGAGQSLPRRGSSASLTLSGARPLSQLGTALRWLEIKAAGRYWSALDGRRDAPIKTPVSRCKVVGCRSACGRGGDIRQMPHRKRPERRPSTRILRCRAADEEVLPTLIALPGRATRAASRAASRLSMARLMIATQLGRCGSPGRKRFFEGPVRLARLSRSVHSAASAEFHCPIRQ